MATLTVAPTGVSTVERPFLEADITTWTDADYRRLLSEAEGLMSATGGPELARLDTLAGLIEAYEESRYSINEWLAAGEFTDHGDARDLPAI